MRILVLTLRLPYPPDDGGAIAIHNTLKHFTHAGHTIHLLSLNTNKHYQEPARVAEICEEVTAVEIDTTIRLLPALNAFLFSKLPYNIKRFLSENFAEKLLSQLKKEQYDVIQLEGVYLGLYLDLIKQTTRTPVVLRAHNVEYKIWERLAQEEPFFLKKWYYNHLAQRGKVFEQNVLPNFDGIVAISDIDAQQFQQLGYRGKSTAIPIGIDFQKFAQFESIQPENKSVCFVGSLEWQPNIQGLQWFLTQVWENVLTQFPDAHFHIAGKNPPKHLLQAKFPNVHIHGYVPDAREFVRKYGLFVVPILSGSGIRIKILEALALKKCVITTPQGAEGIALTNAQHALIAQSPQEFSQAIITCLNDTNYSAQIEQNGYQFVREYYSWDKVINAYVDFYNILRA